MGKFVGHFICFGYLIGFPLMSRAVYPIIKTTTEEWGWSNEYFWAVAVCINSIFAHIFMGTIFTTLYLLKHPFFERYKAEPEPWPWEVDR